MAKSAMKCSPVSCGNKIMDKILPISSLLQPFTLLGLRIWIAAIFWKSGVLKYGDWDTTIMLFEYEHPLPTFLFWGPPLDPAIAGVIGMTFELVMPILLVAGFATRLAVLPLIMMTLVIQFTYMNSYEHFTWFTVLVTILAFGGGRFSIDYFLRTKHRGDIDANTGLVKMVALIIVALLCFVTAHEVLNLLLSPEGWSSWVDSWDALWRKG